MPRSKPLAAALAAFVFSGAALPPFATAANLAVTSVGLPPYAKYGVGDSGPFELPRSGRVVVHLMIYAGSCKWQTSNDQDAKVYAGTAGWTDSPSGTINADSTGASEEVLFTPTKYVQSVGACSWGLYVREN